MSLPLSWAIDPTALVQQIEQRLRADWAPWRAFGWGTPHVRVASFDAPWPDAVAAAPTATTAVARPAAAPAPQPAKPASNAPGSSASASARRIGCWTPRRAAWRVVLTCSVADCHCRHGIPVI